MDKKTYVTRLKKMLLKYPDKTCSHCPVVPYYGDLVYKSTDEKCKICQDFVKLKFIDRDNDIRCCPCYRPNAERAVARAWKAIKKYEEKHGEIKCKN